MKLGIKIATLLFFISGLIFFVGYQSGYFFPNETNTSKPAEPETSTTDEPEVSQDTLQAGNEDSITVDTASKLAETKPVQTKPKTVEVKEAEPRKLHMFSSKSAIVEPFPQGEKYRMSSSKSIRGRRSYTDIFQSNANQHPFLRSDTNLLNNEELDSIRIFDTLR